MKKSTACEKQPTPKKILFDDVVRAHVSANKKHVALYRKQGEEFLVTVDGLDYGPFLQAELATLSPFRLSASTWSFRASRADGVVLVVEGTMHGPFEEVWQPVISPGCWGALVRTGGKYHVLVDGKLSVPFDEIAGDHRCEDAYSIDNNLTIDVPLFYGKKHWAAFGRRGHDLFIVTDTAVAGPFQAIGDQVFSAEPNSLFPASLRRNLSFDGSTVAVGIAKQQAGATAFFLWVDGKELGPCHELPSFHAAADMSLDGKHWAFCDPQAVYTQQGTVDRTTCRNAVLSDNGETLGEVFGSEGDVHLLINGAEHGPFHMVGVPSFSPNGRRWVVSVRPLGDPTHTIIITESGRFGPFNDARPFFIGSKWLAAGIGLDDKAFLNVDGQSFGPYTDLVAPVGNPSDRGNDDDWVAVGTRADGLADVFLSGRLATSIPSFKPSSPPLCRGRHWSVVGNQKDKLVIVEDGMMSAPLGPFKRVIGLHRSENRARLALVAMDANDRYLVQFRSASLGRYQSMPFDFRFSSDGKHWCFQLRDSAGKTTVISDQGTSPAYDEIMDLSLTRHGTAFAGRDGESWWLHVDSHRYGPFMAAGVVATDDSAIGVTLTNGAVKVKAY